MKPNTRKNLLTVFRSHNLAIIAKPTTMPKEASKHYFIFVNFFFARILNMQIPNELAPNVCKETSNSKKKILNIVRQNCTYSHLFY